MQETCKYREFIREVPQQKYKFGVFKGSLKACTLYESMTILDPYIICYNYHLAKADRAKTKQYYVEKNQSV